MFLSSVSRQILILLESGRDTVDLAGVLLERLTFVLCLFPEGPFLGVLGIPSHSVGKVLTNGRFAFVFSGRSPCLLWF